MKRWFVRVAAEPIQHRRRSAPVAVERQTIGAQRIDGDNHDGRAAVLCAERARFALATPDVARQEHVAEQREAPG
jgi:hypothetical protein